VPLRRDLDGPHGQLERVDRIVLEAMSQCQVEDDLGVGGALHLGEQARVDRQHEVSPE
jgi:hypothetical protein